MAFKTSIEWTNQLALLESSIIKTEMSFSISMMANTSLPTRYQKLLQEARELSKSSWTKVIKNARGRKIKKQLEEME